MGAETQEVLNQNWLTPEALVEFVDELRRNGYNVGLDQYIAAEDLLLMLTAKGEKLDNPQRMAQLLGPLLCTSSSEQQTFPQLFTRWAERRLAFLRGQAQIQKQRLEDALETVKKRTLRWEWILLIVVVAIVLFAAWWAVRNFLIQEDFSFKVSPDPTQDETAPLLRLVQLAGVLLLAVSLIWWAWWRFSANMFLTRRQSDEPSEIQQISMNVSPDALYPPLLFLSVARAFRKRVETPSANLHVTKTAERSAEHGGWLIPAYSDQLIPPEYLVLIDRRSRNDHLAQFIEGMVKRLVEHGVFLTIFTFDGDPRLCFPLNGKGIPQSLGNLARQHENMRLVIFSESEALLSPVSGRLASWTRLFNRWTQRAFFTPEPPKDWGIRELELSQQFLVLPYTPDGLATFMRILQNQERAKEVEIRGDGKLPATLQDQYQRWIARDAPNELQISRLMDELHEYLGETGLLWLRACAIYPELHWQVTIYLGQVLTDADGQTLLDAERLVDLSRLPWFRHGSMPDWLRSRLIRALHPEQEQEIRAALATLLVAAVQGKGELLDIEIAHQRREWISGLVRPLLRLLQREAPSESPIQDRVFLDFMLQKIDLAVRAPEILRQQLLTKTKDVIGWKTLIQWVILNVLVTGGWLILTALLDLSNTSLQVFVASLLGFSIGLSQWVFLRRFWKINGFLFVLAGVLSFFLAGMGASPVQEYSSGYPYGYVSLLLLGFFQTALLERKKVPLKRFWYLATLMAGIVNTVGSLLISKYFSESTLSTITIIISSTIIYSLFSGWVLLYLIRVREISSTRLIGLNWILDNWNGFVGGVIAIIFVALIASLLSGDSTIPDSVAFLFFQSFFLVFFFVQSHTLRVVNYFQSWRWYYISSFCSAVMLVFLMSGSGTDILFEYLSYLSLEPSATTTVVGLIWGIVLGLIQAAIWWRSGLLPFQLLIWFLTSVIGWSLTFLAGFYAQQNLSNTGMEDGILLLSLIPLAYGLMTALPMQYFLPIALSYQQTEWARSVIGKLSKTGRAGRGIARYLVSHFVGIRFTKQKNIAATHKLGAIFLNASIFTEESHPDDPLLLALVGVEAKLLEMGKPKANSVIGRLEALQTGYSVYRTMTGKLPPIISDLMELPLDYSRDSLAKAKLLIKQYGGMRGRIDRLPLYPWGQEIWYRLTGRQPKLDQDIDLNAKKTGRIRRKLAHFAQSWLRRTGKTSQLRETGVE